jgi:hypothetical protein
MADLVDRVNPRPWAIGREGPRARALVGQPPRDDRSRKKGRVRTDLSRSAPALHAVLAGPSATAVSRWPAKAAPLPARSKVRPCPRAIAAEPTAAPAGAEHLRQDVGQDLARGEPAGRPQADRHRRVQWQRRVSRSRRPSSAPSGRRPADADEPDPELRERRREDGAPQPPRPARPCQETQHRACGSSATQCGHCQAKQPPSEARREPSNMCFIVETPGLAHPDRVGRTGPRRTPARRRCPRAEDLPYTRGRHGQREVRHVAREQRDHEAVDEPLARGSRPSGSRPRGRMTSEPPAPRRTSAPSRGPAFRPPLAVAGACTCPRCARALRIAARTSSSFASLWKSEVCHLRTRWISVQRMKTATDEYSAGSSRWDQSSMVSSGG